jgi:hypothetical protein
VVVAVLMVGGEHGYLAARVAAQVVRAYVEKKHGNKPDIKTASAAPGLEGMAAASPAKEADAGRAVRAKVEAAIAGSRAEDEMAALWTHSDSEGHEVLDAGRFALRDWAARPAAAKSLERVP